MVPPEEARGHIVRRFRRPVERLLPDLLARGDVDRDGRPRVGDVHDAVVAIGRPLAGEIMSAFSEIFPSICRVLKSSNIP